jgi:hypothetical protein
MARPAHTRNAMARNPFLIDSMEETRNPNRSKNPFLPSIFPIVAIKKTHVTCVTQVFSESCAK